MLALGCAPPTINSLDPASGPEHTVVEVAGNWRIFAGVEWDGAAIPQPWYGAYFFSVPPGPSTGAHDVTVSNNQSTSPASPFTVTAPVAWPTPVVKGVQLFNTRFLVDGTLAGGIFVYGSNVDVGATVLIDGVAIMTGLANPPFESTWELVENKFANAPVLNPNGTLWVAIHIDRGQGGAFTGRGTGVSFASGISYTVTTSATDVNLYDVKAAEFDSDRLEIFRYGVWASAMTGSDASGLAEGIPANDFFVSMNTVAAGYQTDLSRAETFIHELGHTLGFGHGGASRRQPRGRTQSPERHELLLAVSVGAGGLHHLRPLPDDPLAELLGRHGGGTGRDQPRREPRRVRPRRSPSPGAERGSGRLSTGTATGPPRPACRRISTPTTAATTTRFSTTTMSGIR